MKRKIVLTGIIRYNDEYLIVKRSKNDDFLPGIWEFPGGNIEDGELILDALKREIYEEIGLTIDTNKSLLEHFYDTINEKTERYHYIELDFLIEVDTKELDIKLSEEHDEFCWVKKDCSVIDDFIRAKIEKL